MMNQEEQMFISVLIGMVVTTISITIGVFLYCKKHKLTLTGLVLKITDPNR